MGDQELWRKNIPEDFQGKMGENWDDDVEMGPIYWSAVGIAGSVAFAFVLCWFLMPALDLTLEETQLSPLAEANERRLPPQPWLQPKPELEMDALLEANAEHLSSYGWNDQLNGVVHIPVGRAMDLMAASFPQPQDVPAEVVEAVSEPTVEDQPADDGGEEPTEDPAHAESGPADGESHAADGEAHG